MTALRSHRTASAQNSSREEIKIEGWFKLLETLHLHTHTLPRVSKRRPAGSHKTRTARSHMQQLTVHMWPGWGHFYTRLRVTQIQKTYPGFYMKSICPHQFTSDLKHCAFSLTNRCEEIFSPRSSSPLCLMTLKESRYKATPRLGLLHVS